MKVSGLCATPRSNQTSLFGCAHCTLDLLTAEQVMRVYSERAIHVYPLYVRHRTYNTLRARDTPL